MQVEAQAAIGAEAGPDALGAVEFELAVDMQDPIRTAFDECVRSAAAVVGGELLFDMPSDGSVEDASRIAAVRIANPQRDDILFAILNEAGDTIRSPDREEIGERFYGFARAFVGVLTRIRDDMPFGGMETEGSA